MHKKELETLITDITPVNSYERTFDAHCNAKRPRLSTGYLSLDIALNGGLGNELYIMGAETSTGKSALMMAIAENLATSGAADVLYFALEMGTDEFVARGISRASFEASLKNPNAIKLTAADILNWTYDPIINDFTHIPLSSYAQYKEEYFKGKDHLYIIESKIDSWAVKDIANVAALWKKQHPDREVVVFLDYLQLISTDTTQKFQDRKSKVDEAVFTLKCLASQIGMPVFTASSIGRTAYNGMVSVSSFKESGDIEYTGGILLGWNWIGVTNESADDKREEEKARCRERGWREMRLEVLKSRNAARGNTVTLYYYPAYNYFVTEQDFRPILDADGNPFDRSATPTRTIFC